MSQHPYANALALPAHRASQQLYPALPTPLPPPVARPATAPADIGGFPTPAAKQRPPVRRPSGRFVLPASKVALALHGQAHGAARPAYGRGAVVDGAVTVPAGAGATKIDAQLEGYVSIRELGGGGTSKTTTLSETLVFWDGPSGSCPATLPFNTALPSHYTDHLGQRIVLPPSFSDRMPGMPGFQCLVEYFITLSVTHQRDRGSMWRKSTVLRTPFDYRPRTRPSHSSPMPASSRKSRSKPTTQFVSIIESCTPVISNVLTYLYLPYSQICPMSATIPFYLKLSGPEDSLKLFATCSDAPSSFHPFSSSETLLSTSQGRRLTLGRAACSRPDIRILLVRQVCADARNTGVCVLNSSSRSHMLKNTVIGEGRLDRATKGTDAITWAGEIKIACELPCGGFTTPTLIVQDAIILTIKSRDPSSSAFEEFRQVVPVRLTTDAYDCWSAVKVTEI